MTASHLHPVRLDPGPLDSAVGGRLRVIVRHPREDDPGSASGPRRRVVLVHGTMDRATSFTRLKARLPDWTIMSYDRRGYARSSHLTAGGGFHEQVSDLVDVLDGEPAVAFGHSFGGDVVLATAAEHPQLISAAVVWEPPQPWLPWWPSPDGWGQDSAPGEGSRSPETDPADQAETFMRRMVGDRIWERLPSSTRVERRAEGLTLVSEIRSLGTGPVFDPARIAVPVIVGRGGKSAGFQRRATRELADNLERGQLAEIPEAGHGAHLSHPAELARLIVLAGTQAGQEVGDHAVPASRHR
jgi:pimeloyl-ACP methyl ester carboxylesterase